MPWVGVHGVFREALSGPHAVNHKHIFVALGLEQEGCVNGGSRAGENAAWPRPTQRTDNLVF